MKVEQRGGAWIVRIGEGRFEGFMSFEKEEYAIAWVKRLIREERERERLEREREETEV